MTIMNGSTLMSLKRTLRTKLKRTILSLKMTLRTKLKRNLKVIIKVEKMQTKLKVMI